MNVTSVSEPLHSEKDRRRFCWSISAVSGTASPSASRAVMAVWFGVAASGGSTNSVLHLIALAREAKVPLTIDDFDEISRRTPLITDLMPSGKYAAADLDKAGGTQVVAKRMVEAGYLAPTAVTCTGRSIAEEAESAVPSVPETPANEINDGTRTNASSRDMGSRHRSRALPRASRRRENP